MRVVPALFAVALLLSGCGGVDNPLGRVKVTGKVTLGGEPLKQGSISFDPQGNVPTSSGGEIENGVYTLSVENGLAPGDYVVRISATEGGPTVGAAPGESAEVAKELIPSEFNIKSTQKVTVKKDSENNFNFDIPAKAK